jgi:Haem-containing dehydratase
MTQGFNSVTQRSKPDDFQAPYPAYGVKPHTVKSDFTMGLIGIQSVNGVDTAPLETRLIALIKEEARGRPLHFERAWFDDAQGTRNDVLMPYWSDRESQTAFWDRDDVQDFIEERQTGSIGWWAEYFSCVPTRLDASYSVPEPKYGIARYHEPEVEQYHAYMGSMRDRVPDYLSGASDGPVGQLRRTADRPDSRGRTLRIDDLPNNLCFIRGGFSWKEALPEEQEIFMRDMMVVYREGAEYLRDNPEESNCISMRMAEAVQTDFDSGIQSNVLGWFLNLQELERWTRSHPRHLAIMKSIIDYMKRFDFKPKLTLSHEVAVVPEGQVVCYYANCHPETGFLPFFPARQVG